MGSVKGRLREKGQETRDSMIKRGGSLKDRSMEVAKELRRSGRSYMSGTGERKGVTLTDGPAINEDFVVGEQSEDEMLGDERPNDERTQRYQRI